MFKSIGRNNRLFMLGNFLFALSYGLWMNLRQLHLLELGATPAQIGTVFALIALAGGLLPLPAGLLADRIGPKRVVLAAWLFAVVGVLVAAFAQTWPVAGAGYVVFMLCVAANPAVVSYVLLHTPDRDHEGRAEQAMATVFASWPAAMVFAPALGGLIAEWLGIQADLWIGAAGFLLAVVVFALADPAPVNVVAGRSKPLALSHNRHFVALVVVFSLALLAMNLGFALAPTYLEDTRGFSTGHIGVLFSLASVGMLLFRSVVIEFRPRVSFALLVGAALLGTLGLWQAPAPIPTGAAFMLLGAISTTWVVMQASIGRSVPEHVRGLALGVSESLYFGSMALASWLAGQLYGATPAHDLPFLAGAIATLFVLLLWVALPVGRRPSGELVTP